MNSIKTNLCNKLNKEHLTNSYALPTQARGVASGGGGVGLGMSPLPPNDDESEEDCDDLVAAVALKRKKTPSQYASILSYTLKAEIDIVKYAAINVDISDNVPIQPVTSINIREKEMEDAVQRMPSHSELAEKNADPWSPDAASTANPKAAVNRITCVSQNRTATTIRTRTQYGSWRYGCSSARLRAFQPRGLGVRSSGSTAPYARGLS
uniref:Uncharacterized protein n=1 Tax=Timema tahoe TaxID=61484 RepID=A0A7R9FE44_9NEOP|nr:unnamed protein product [Timema tahoe]